MLFNSLSFLVFFPLCIGVYYILPKKLRAFFLLAASLFFYMCWNVAYGLLLVGTILITYVSGILLTKYRDNSKVRKCIVAAGLVVNLGILFVFKYFDFFAATFNKVMKLKNGIGLLNLILPVGISFYIFQAVGYIIDVYRGREAEKNIVKYALFVSFFPQLVAGPIERSGNLLSQIGDLDKRNFFNEEDFVKGAFTMLYGYILKMLIADRAAILVDTVFDPEKYSLFGGYEVILAAVLFSIQIYCDFAGYTYIAIGAARMMGFKLCRNFNTPYLSIGIKDFWDRWHISLSGWFRDYLYFPLGGSKKGKVRKYLNIIIVFLVSGLWHGASFHFVVWGGIHGVLRILDELTLKARRKLAEKLHYNVSSFSGKALGVGITFVMVTLCWVFFRASSSGQAIALIKSMFSDAHLWQLADSSLLNLGLDAKEMNVLLIFGLIMFIVDFATKKGRDVLETIYRQDMWFKFLLMFAGIISIVIFGIYGTEYDAAAFIYFQF